MKTFVPLTQNLKKFTLIIIAVISGLFIQAQSGSGGGSSNLSQGLKFDGYTRIAGSNYNVGAEFLFSQVNDSTDAVVRIDSLVNGATVTMIDDNGNGIGYKDAFQPAIKSGNIIGKSYAVFTISFLRKGTNTPIALEDVKATALDIDGNATLKEFIDVNIGNGATANYMSTTSDLSILQLLPGNYMVQNILGIERNGIDTSSYNNMFTASNTTGISSFQVRYGTMTIIPSTTTRQFSLYMKGFYYPSSTLPVNLTSFTATLNKNNKVDLKWITASEMNVSHFIIEKSTDGVNYHDAAMVFAYGNTTQDMNYSYADNLGNMQDGVVYYRLRSEDVDGKTQVSETRIIKLSSMSMNTVSIMTYPNPVSTELRITIPTDWQSKKVSYEIYTLGGKLVNKVERTSSSQTESVNMSSIGSGMYIVRAICNGQMAQQKIIKQ